MNKSYSVRVDERKQHIGFKAVKRRQLRFIEVVACIGLLILVLCVQVSLSINSLLSAVAGALTYAVVRHFVGKGKVEG